MLVVGCREYAMYLKGGGSSETFLRNLLQVFGMMQLLWESSLSVIYSSFTK